jgi:type I restriction enzyme S subunit
MLRDRHATGSVRAMIKQTTGIQNLDLRLYFRSHVAVPPLEEQAAAVDRIERQVQRLDAGPQRTEREIQLLAEYEKRLTADVVTGQLDVRQVAATLPPIDPAEVFAAPNGTDLEDDEETVEDDELEGADHVADE